MYCPKRGTQSTNDQKFCRSCGFDLKVISQAMAGKQPLSEAGDVGEAIEQKKKKFMGWGLATMMGGIVLMILLAVIGKAILRVAPDIGKLMQELTGLGAAILLSGVGLMIYSAFITSKRDQVQAEKTSALPAQQSINLQPESLPQPAASVTEGTTELFDSANHSIPARNTAPQNMRDVEVESR